MTVPLKLVSLGSVAVSAANGIVKSFCYSSIGTLISKIGGFGNAGSPIAPKNLTVLEDSLLFISSTAQLGILDTSSGTVYFKKESVIKLEFTISCFFPDTFVVGLLEPGDYVVETEMAGFVDGGCGYSVSQYKGSIS